MTKAVIQNRVQEIDARGWQSVPQEMLSGDQPKLFKGLVSHWPVVEAGKQSAEALIAYLRKFSCNSDVAMLKLDASHKGRYFYNGDMTAFNFSRQPTTLENFFDQLLAAQQQTQPDHIYVDSFAIREGLPGFRMENDTKVPHETPQVKFWISNTTRIAAHYDQPNNLACVVAGKRRFTLFPPDQISNLYPGPYEFTPAGVPISCVDFENVDRQKFPLFEKAEAAGFIADMEPGDALYLPSYWWHQVESLSPYNMLVNYWWQSVPSFIASANVSLQHAMMSIRSLPPEHRAAWKAIFDYYIFGDQDGQYDHIPPESLGILRQATPELLDYLFKKVFAIMKKSPYVKNNG